MTQGGEPIWQVPRIPASAGALVFDERGRLLVLNPTYKRQWTIPGGQLEADGETPWEASAARRARSAGSRSRRGRLVCVDFRPAKDLRPPGGLRFVFHCGVLGREAIGSITLQSQEISEHRFVSLDEAAALLAPRCAGGCWRAPEPTAACTSRTGARSRR